MAEPIHIGGRKWDSADPITGATGKENLNAAVHGGIVWSRESMGLFIEIEAMYYMKNDFSIGSYPGSSGTPFAVTGNTTNYVYLDDTDNIVINTTGFPVSGWFVVLAIVNATLTSVFSIINIQQVSPQGSASAGVQNFTVHFPVLNVGTGDEPIVEIAPSDPTQAGSMSAAQATKLAGIETSADVTDATNVAAAGALMKSAFADHGALAMGSGTPGAPSQLTPGAIGTFLMSMGAGAALAWNAISAFASQVWIGNMVDILTDTDDYFELSEVAHIGDITLEDDYKIRFAQAGTYVGFMLVRTENVSGYNLDVDAEFPQGTPVATIDYNPGAVGSFRIPLVLPIVFQLASVDAPDDLVFKVNAGALFGTNPGPENIIVIWKISN